MQPTPTEKLTTANITDIMQTACIDYSMSVIISRALPRRAQRSQNHKLTSPSNRIS